MSHDKIIKFPGAARDEKHDSVEDALNTMSDIEDILEKMDELQVSTRDELLELLTSLERQIPDQPE